MLSLLHCRPEDDTIEVLKATFLLNCSTGREVLSACSCVDQQRFPTRKFWDLLK